MGYYRTRGLRGSALEEYINITNTKYREHGLALVQKIPTPIKPVELDKEKGNIKKAFFEERSTVDYIGMVQGYGICFDAKETTKETYPLRNIHEHQMSFMEDFEAQRGIAFFILSFTLKDEVYFIPYRFIKERFKIMKEGGKKSFHYKEIKNFYRIENRNGYLLHYIEALDMYMEDIKIHNITT